MTNENDKKNVVAYLERVFQQEGFRYLLIILAIILGFSFIFGTVVSGFLIALLKIIQASGLVIV